MTIQTLKQPSGKFASTGEAYGATLMKLAEEGARFAFVTSDNVGRNSALGTLMSRYPERCYDVGIAEGNQVGVAAGLALGGNQLVFCKGFGIFLALRAADQINVDVAYNHVPVRLMADHCGVTAAGGPTHNMVSDLALLRAIPDLTIVSPADAIEAAKLVKASVEYPGPMYFRFSKGIDPVIYATDDYPFEIGKAITLREGTDVTLIGMGVSVAWTLEAADLLAQAGIGARVLNMHTLKPLDEAAVLAAAQETRGVVTVEDHGKIGGLGSAVADCLMAKGAFAKLRKIGFPDAFMPAETIAGTYERYGMTPRDIASCAAAILE